MHMFHTMSVAHQVNQWIIHPFLIPKSTQGTLKKLLTVLCQQNRSLSSHLSTLKAPSQQIKFLNTEGQDIGHLHSRGNFRKILTVSAPLRSYVSQKDYQFPVVDEGELEEQYVRGSGPGGQAVNKTANCVVLKHLPTGIVVKSHESRSLDTNRRTARLKLRDRLDLLINGENSFQMMQRREETKRRIQKKKKTNEKLELKRAFKQEMKRIKEE
ncbi:mitochondrial translation release factor in rescue-like [Haliotis asinina]|uniref:mitochondrial translation release factor in rescue-like n=1 Tax=Haliotis asinina TaxID=109174 RepID=UPI003532451A